MPVTSMLMVVGTASLQINGQTGDSVILLNCLESVLAPAMVLHHLHKRFSRNTGTETKPIITEAKKVENKKDCAKFQKIVESL